MAKLTLATVPYVNAYPLVFGLKEAAGGEIDLLSAPPSALPALLDSGRAQAVLVSSIEAVQRPDRAWIGELCIGSDGPVESVRLFSKVPFHQIKRVALDQSSMTSNILALILLEGLFGVKPQTFTHPPLQSEMLAKADACLLIGDIGMMAPSDGLEVLDLGQGWKQLTGLPFVWAGWIGTPGYDSSLPLQLQAAYELSACGIFPSDMAPAAPDMKKRELALNWAEAESGWTRSRLDHYLNSIMIYRLSEKMKQGREEYWSRAKAYLP